MCGIAGVIGFQGNEVDAGELASRMAWQLRHRGPDGAAFYYDNHEALLVHTRLSIIDLSGGTQPIHNEDKTIWLVFNGEIFNFIELREVLVSKGHSFYTHSDTEVIVHLYEEFGLEFVHHLNGQFAIAIWDSRTDSCILARDRAGISPLYYQHRDGRLTFGSEIKSLLEDNKNPPIIDKVALNQIFTFWTTLPSRTPFEQINALPPGQIAIYSNGTLSLRTYWDLEFPDNHDQYCADADSSAQALEELLLDATRIRLRSDVPVGAYLSGGLDSSVLTSAMHRFDLAELSTFSISFADEDHDESAYQRAMVDYLGANHKNIHCDNSDIGDDFMAAMWHIEYPLIRTAPIPMGFLSELAHQNKYKVVLTGEGADEIFGGYDLFKETKIRQFWSANPDSAFRASLLSRLYPYLNLNQGTSNAYVKNFFGAGIEDKHTPLFSHLMRFNSTSRIKTFYVNEIDQGFKDSALVELTHSLPEDYNRWHWLNKAQYLEVKTLMTSYLLTSQGDRMLMRNSVEGRFPFLDHRLMEFAAGLHPKLKIKGLNEKYILRKAMNHFLPEAIAKRVKQPYRAPNAPAFFGGKAPDYIEQLIDSSLIEKLGFFDEKKLHMLFRKAKSGKPMSYADNMAVVAMLSTLAIFKLFVVDFHKNFGFGNYPHPPVQRIA